MEVWLRTNGKCPFWGREVGVDEEQPKLDRSRRLRGRKKAVNEENPASKTRARYEGWGARYSMNTVHADVTCTPSKPKPPQFHLALQKSGITIPGGS